jgi:hypothetical protein
MFLFCFVQTVFDLECDQGKYHLKGPNGRYWGVDGDGVHCNSGECWSAGLNLCRGTLG